jgi:wyosine [tRNA(Phe)-imidazoG37] synthetase (radical SAM superfamily)
MHREDKIFDNFDGRKMTALVSHWMPLKDGKIPSPIANSLDLSSRKLCPNKCYFCNIKEQIEVGHMTDETFSHVLNVYKNHNVKSSCISGGGESLMNSRCEEYFKEIIKCGTQIGIITNGVIYRKIPLECKFVNVSVNAYDEESYAAMCCVDGKRFNVVCDNIKQWVDDGQLVTYKVMVSDRNKDLSIFVKCVEVADKLGIKNILFRFAMLPWNEIDKTEYTFISEFEADLFSAQIEILRKYYPHINIQFPLERYDRRSRKYVPKRCVGGLINFVTLFNGDVMVCSDFRSCEKMKLCHISEFNDFWGSNKHWEIVKSVDTNNCPRCSFLMHDTILDQFVFNDVSNQYFI